MADKKNENRFMSMLERRDIIRKAAPEEDEPAQEQPVETRTLPEADLRSLFGTTGDSPKVTPASRQPVPGLLHPTMPNEHGMQADNEQPKPVEERVAPAQPKPTMIMEPLLKEPPATIIESTVTQPPTPQF